MSIESELKMIQKQNGGLLLVEDGVAWAKAHPKSELHSALEWDDKKAGHEYRIWQVRRLISIHIKNEVGVRTTVSLTIDRNNGGGYRDVSDVMKRPNLREVMLSDALDELERIQKKYDGIVELARVWEEADRVRNRKKKAA